MNQMNEDAEFDITRSTDLEFHREVFRATVEHYELDLDRRDERIAGLTAERDVLLGKLAVTRARLGRLYGTWLWRASRRIVLGPRERE